MLPRASPDVPGSVWPAGKIRPHDRDDNWGDALGGIR
jgi:hypothetical protein